MATTPSLADELREHYVAGFERIRAGFIATGDGRAAMVDRTLLIEEICLRLWNEKVASEPGAPRNLALVAVGGFGRRALFPYSDVDLLFLPASREDEHKFKDRIRAFSQELWDLRVKLSPTTRNLAECDRFEPDNPEFLISLLDCRYLAGDLDLFTRLREKVIPRLINQESQALLQRLADITRERYAKYGETIFHLEPNVKDTPGGLRDYNVAFWLAQVSAMEKLRGWPDQKALLSPSVRRQLDPAFEFLAAVRCFLHFRHGRDDNALTWAAQDEAAIHRIGIFDSTGGADDGVLNAADWMRFYFDRTRSIHRATTQLLQEIPAAWSSLYRQFQSWRSRISNADFSVVHGLVFAQQPDALHDSDMMLRLFDFMAHHGLRLSTTTESKIEQFLPSLAATPPKGAELWRYVQVILLEPHAASALREMHALRLLTILLPELKPIDSLVVRDFYHRFTVDEHSFLAIENLHSLAQAQSEWDKRYAELFQELERPELLMLSLLLHDTGKGVSSTNHVAASVEISAQCLERLDLEPQDRDTVLFLVGSHLELSAVLRRDIFDPTTIRSFAEKVGAPERLKMLCLMTYTDLKSVNPEALTQWKAEQIWQVYIAAANYLSHSADQRLHAEAGNENLAQLQTLGPVAAKKLNSFLEGLPRRYLQTYSPEDMLHHAEMAKRLDRTPVQLQLKRGRHWFELTLVTKDRARLFATISGVLAGWGMNIVKANAFSNAGGAVVDSFYFTDRFRTLELNLPEWERFRNHISDVLLGKASLEPRLQDRLRGEKQDAPKVKIDTHVSFDDDCSAGSTLMEVIAPDRPGLLHRISSELADEKCNIDIALIDTEGPMAIDVFYLTSSGRKLHASQQKNLKHAIVARLMA
jgi:[protein-PII] uridylyltransferase